MEQQNQVINEFTEYNYLLSDSGWKESLPEFTLYASAEQEEEPRVSVVIANFNNGPYLRRMMDSLINQTIGLDQLQIMFIDDRSTDDSLEIVMEYITDHDNIEIYHLDKNTGGAHGPRNVGLLNSRGKYLVFLDADDWYHLDGLRVLADLLDESNDGIAFGGLIRSINGELSLEELAYIEKDSINREVSELPYDFYSWLGPQSNMVRASLVKDNNLHFIDQRVADDVSFFMQVMLLSKKISQSTKIVTYLNRDDNNFSLSKSVNETFLVSWLRALSYFLQTYDLDTALERFISKRIEWLVIDFLLRWDTGYGFDRRKLRHFEELVTKYLGELSFDPSVYFQGEERKITWRALKEKNYNFLIEFLQWFSLPPFDKKIELVSKQYVQVPDNKDLPQVPFTVIARGNFVEVTSKGIVVDFSLYTDEIVNFCEIRNEKDPSDRLICNVDKISDTNYQAIIGAVEYENLSKGCFLVFVRTNGFHETPMMFGSIGQYTPSSVVAKKKKNLVIVKSKLQEKLPLDRVVLEVDQNDIVNSSYHEGKNFIVTEGHVPIYASERATIENVIGELPKGTMFRAVGFARSENKDFLVMLDSGGFVPAKKSDILKLAEGIDVTNYDVSVGSYRIQSSSEKGYINPSFMRRFLSRSYKRGTVVNGIGFGISDNGYPRLRLSDGNYVTSNSKFIKREGD